MKKIILSIFLFFSFLCANVVFAQTDISETKKEIILLYNSNNLEAAYNLISKITEENRDYEIWYLLGNISQDLDNDENAIFFLQKSVILNPKFDKAHYNLGNIYLKQEKYNIAISEYKTAIKYNKEIAYYYYNLGYVYLCQKDYKNAEKVLKKAIKIKPEQADFYYNLAVAYKNLNKIEEAQNAVEIYNKLQEEEN